MTERAAGLDWQTIGIVGLCLVLGFVIVWTVLSARSSERTGERTNRSESEKSASAKETKDDRET
jgi:hypothetical protein